MKSVFISGSFVFGVVSVYYVVVVFEVVLGFFVWVVV